jgi:hypothetical protein
MGPGSSSAQHGAQHKKVLGRILQNKTKQNKTKQTKKVKAKHKWAFSKIIEPPQRSIHQRLPLAQIFGCCWALGAGSDRTAQTFDGLGHCPTQKLWI